MRKTNGYYGIIAEEETNKYKPEEELRTERLYTRLTKDEKELIKKLAKLQHMDCSEFIRWLVFNRYLNEFIK